ncbi:hypothetical protein CKO28_20125 [Rhodovibrio sodomensis]|uniref:Phosphate ABC transporter substrate-binding protein n=2 Tax=Rhodovibrio sodomensis TaxID=1088 RepID=A0ABS1DJD9_9PROT|nr:PhnD/SsuA/transferrin family substrate-binding protein [Rhodovibrio sodomensis]MBK1670334.1 hypothetical protein [Rhodovibrio sodomensis]
MYDLPELRGATDAWWSGIARHLRAAGVAGVPERLTRPRAVAAVWDDPDLLLGQGCGYPFTQAYADRWQYLATPVYAVPGCDGPAYRSWLVVAEAAPVTAVADLLGTTAAVNGATSHSGWIALLAALADHAPPGGRPLGQVVWTGGHRASLRAVADGQADIAAVDCVTHALLAAHAPQALAGTRVLAGTPAAPGLPLIAGENVDRDTRRRVRAALHAAVADPALAAARRALRLDGLRVLPPDAYARIGALAAAGGAAPTD